MTDDPNAVFAIESDPPDLAGRRERRIAEHMERELAAVQKRADEDDERMAAAARGEPFWRSGAAAEVTGVAEYLPLTMADRSLLEWAERQDEAMRLERAAADQLKPPTTLTEHYAGATVDVPGGTIELGLQRNRGEPIALKRAEMKRIVAEEALVLNGDDITEDSAARLSDRIDARFAETWPGRAWWVEIWRAEERLTQVYHRWPWPGDAR